MQRIVRMWIGWFVFWGVVLSGLGPKPASADVLELLPFETFECQNDDCPVDFTETGGQDAAASGRVAEGRSRAGAFGQTRTSQATVGLRFQVCEPTRARILIRGSYMGLLRGTGGGTINRARMDLSAVLRDLTTDTLLERSLIRREEELGGPFRTDNTFIPQNNLGGPGDTTGIIVEGDILPGRTYLAGLELRTEARGAAPRALADLKNGNFQSELFLIRIELDPGLEDRDGDGLYDVWEEEGLRDCEGNVAVDLPAFGADPDRKDVFVEYDWLPGFAPTKADIDFVKTRFAAAPGDSGVDRIANPDGSEGIQLWIDTGGLTEGGVLVGDDFGGGDQIDLTDVPNGRDIPRLGGDADGDGVADFREIKDLYFDPARRAVFHYAISGPGGAGEPGPTVPGANSCRDGIDNDSDGLIDGQDALDCFGGGQAGGGANFFVTGADAGTFMHELGHTLALHHGGNEPNNCKPNYLSIMNYVYAGGVPRDDDGDGVFEARTEDFSGVPLPGGGVATAPLGDLIENQLDESALVDPADPVHGLRWVDGEGVGRTSAVGAPIDWDGDGNIQGDLDGSGTIDGDETLSVVNVNRGDENGMPAACEQASADAGHPANETLSGANDWFTLVFRFSPDSAVAGAAIEDIIEEEGFDVAEIEAIFNATDLSLAKVVDPDPWVGGQEVTYRLEVTNRGPNGAAAIELIDTPPDGVRFVDPPETCEPRADGSLACTLDPLPVGETAALELRARLPVITDCGRGQFRYMSNSASVFDQIGRELSSIDNRATARHAVLCPIYERPAKFVCGEMVDPESRAFLSAAYGSSVNVHNPNDEEVFVFAKLALARPSAALSPGTVTPIDLFSFNYDESVVIDCDVVRARLFPNGFPDGLIDGFLVLQSARSVDAVAVYTAGPLGAGPAGSAPVGYGAQASIDVEPVPERRRAPPDPLADLALRIEASDLNCGPELCRMSLRYMVENVGDADAPAFATTVAGASGALLGTDPWDNGLPAAAGETRPFAVTFATAELQPGFELCLTADAPANRVEEIDEGNNADCLSLSLP